MFKYFANSINSQFKDGKNVEIQGKIAWHSESAVNFIETCRAEVAAYGNNPPAAKRRYDRPKYGKTLKFERFSITNFKPFQIFIMKEKEVYILFS